LYRECAQAHQHNGAQPDGARCAHSAIEIHFAFPPAQNRRTQDVQFETYIREHVRNVKKFLNTGSGNTRLERTAAVLASKRSHAAWFA
jgi:hypothetical protein